MNKAGSLTPEKARDKMMSGPVPGENYTSDTKNYAWHRPPKYTDMSSAMEYVFDHLLEENNSKGVLTSMEMGIPISALVDMFVMSGVGKGKWTPDFAILLAGPVAHVMKLMADSYEIDYDMGIDTKKKIPSANHFRNLSKPIETTKKKQEALRQQVDEKVQEPSNAPMNTGFLGEMA